MKWKDEYTRIAEGAAKLGATEREIAEMFGVSEVTLNAWKRDKPEFLAALKLGKEGPDDRVERSLYNRAVGYSFESVKVFQFQGAIVEAPVVEHVPPDVTAGIFWLKNRRPELWRDVKAIEGTVAVKDERSEEDRARALALLVARGVREGASDGGGRTH